VPWRSGRASSPLREINPQKSPSYGIRRASAIQPAIGNRKADGKLDRNWLKGALGDVMHAVLCEAGHDLRMILRKLPLLCVFILSAF
jgi:IS5 family transposase